MRILFLGTSPFAVPTLQAILSSSHVTVGILTQPDRPKGRSRPLSPSAVKLSAPASVPLHQPAILKDPGVMETVRQIRPDCAVVVAYGQLLPPEFLSLFSKGAYNLHPSLLPKYRGAAPIAWSLLRGETETGLTLFRMDERLDHGPLLLQRKLSIRPEEEAVALSDRLSKQGADFVLEGLSLLERETNPTLTPQADSAATLAPRLTKADGLLQWEQPCRHIHNQVRGVQPWPGALTRWATKEVKIHQTFPDPSRNTPGLVPGSVTEADPLRGLWIQTGQGQIRIDRLQLAGRKILAAPEFLRGHSLSRGERFESVSP